MLPVLLQRLRGGMELVALPRPEQQAVLDELMTIHADALRPGSRTPRRADAGRDRAAHARRGRDRAAGPRPFSDSVIDLASMDTVPAEVLATGGETDDEAGQRVEGAARRRSGCASSCNGRWSRCQLLWRSDQGQFFLFAGETPGRDPFDHAGGRSNA